MEWIYALFAFLVMGYCGAIVSRWCGAEKSPIPYGLEQFIYGLPYALCGNFKLIDTLLAYAGAVLGKRMGHGQYMGLPDEHGDPAGDEKYDFIVRWVFGPECPQPRRYWRNVIGLAFSGLWVVLVPVTGLIFSQHFAAAAVVFLGGIAKAPAYMISYRFGKRTEGGEYLTGFFGWGSLGLAAFL